MTSQEHLNRMNEIRVAIDVLQNRLKSGNFLDEMSLTELQRTLSLPNTKDIQRIIEHLENAYTAERIAYSSAKRQEVLLELEPEIEFYCRDMELMRPALCDLQSKVNSIDARRMDISQRLQNAGVNHISLPHLGMLPKALGALLSPPTGPVPDLKLWVNADGSTEGITAVEYKRRKEAAGNESGGLVSWLKALAPNAGKADVLHAKA